MAYVLALVPVGFCVCKIYRNYTGSKDINCPHTDTLRKKGVVDRLLAGPSPPISHVSESQLEKLIKTNSAVREHASRVRRAWEESRASTPQRLGEQNLQDLLKENSCLRVYEAELRRASDLQGKDLQNSPDNMQ